MGATDSIAKSVIVDGSNLATEGRDTPSFAQLKSALADFRVEYPKAKLTVVVDATFEHRIESSELKEYEKAESGGELITPPAGAIGRGDAFVLRIADKTGATVLSNDSFQEFHGDYPWLFTEGRLIGGKPVPGVGWIYTLRTPVRGPKSRVSVAEANKRRRKAEAANAGYSTLEEEVAARRAKQSGKSSGPTKDVSAKAVVEAKISKAAVETKTSKQSTAPEADVVALKNAKKRRRRRGGGELRQVNDLLPFLEFISAHPRGSRVLGTVDSFASHGCYVSIDNVRCYLPLTNIAEIPPRSARDVLHRGQELQLEIVGFQAQRRSVELSVPGRLASAARKQFASEYPEDHKASASTNAVVALTQGTIDNDDLVAEAGFISSNVKPAKPVRSEKQSKALRNKVDAGKSSDKSETKKVASRKALEKKVSDKKAPAKKVMVKNAAAKKVAAKEIAAKSTTAKKAPAKKLVVKNTVRRNSPAKSAIKSVTAKKAPAKKLVVKNTVRRNSPAKGATESVTAKKALAKKLAAKESVDKKAPGKKFKTKTAASKKAHTKNTLV